MREDRIDTRTEDEKKPGDEKPKAEEGSVADDPAAKPADDEDRAPTSVAAKISDPLPPAKAEEDPRPNTQAVPPISMDPVELPAKD